jgi:hypothetical protein
MPHGQDLKKRIVNRIPPVDAALPSGAASFGEYRQTERQFSAKIGFMATFGEAFDQRIESYEWC